MALRARTRSIRALVIVLVTISLVTITVDYREGESGPLAGMGRVALSIIAPLQEAVSKVLRPVGDFFTTLTRIPSIRQETERLRRELEQARADRIRIAEIEAEIAQLEALLDLQLSLPVHLELIEAEVIGSGVSNFEWTITIDQGSSQGVAVDMPVVAPAGLIGHVVKVSSDAAEVLLILDPNSRVAARMLETRVTGLLQGQGDRDLELSLVNPEVPVEPGAVVVTAGYQGGLYPPGIPIGEVARVLPDPAALDQFIRVRPYVDFSTLDIVAVVLSRSGE